jgi:hypothetical protein
MLNIHRAKHFLTATIRAAASIERDNPKAFDSQAGDWLLTDLSYALESLGGPVATKHPESAAALDAAMDDCGNAAGNTEEEMHWPMGEHTLTLAQQLFGAVMPTAMFHTGWPAEYYDMMEVGYILSKRMSPERVKFMVDAIWKEVDRYEAEKKVSEEKV